LPTGLANLGNTCYLNSSIQCLKRIDEFKDFFLNNQISNTQTPEGKLAYFMQSLIKQLERKGESFEPYEFVRIFMQIFPQFAEKTSTGVFKQQDADECFQNLLSYLEMVMYTKDMEGDTINLIRDLFEINFEVK
jgi:ubiquitin carboxyl-terminal hydrolase 14